MTTDDVRKRLREYADFHTAHLSRMDAILLLDAFSAGFAAAREMCRKMAAEHSECFQKSLCERIRALEGAAPLMAPKWIAVSERMPIEGFLYLTIHGDDDSSMRADYYGRHGWERPKYIDWEITHWQPMPAPPAHGAKGEG